MMEDFELPSYEAALSAEQHQLMPCTDSLCFLAEQHQLMSCTNDGFEPEIDYSIPPSAPPLVRRPKIYLPNVGALTEEMIRRACREYAEDSCCYGTRFINSMNITNITNSYTFNYKLESFCERRGTASKFTPYYGQVVDGPENGPEPDPWSIEVPTSAEFKACQKNVEIPHSANVKQCGTCQGNRRIPCDSCYGNGHYKCFQCEGRGRDSDDDRCPSCDGSGKRKCINCYGTGQVECRLCDGYGRLKHYKVLVVKRRSHAEEFLSNTMNLPRNCILTLAGRLIFTEQGKQVSPLTNFRDQLVCEASRNMIQKHQRVFPNEAIIMQRHTLRVIPITKVNYTWSGIEGEFYIYGFKNKVYFEKYPQKCCCVCM